MFGVECYALLTFDWIGSFKVCAKGDLSDMTLQHFKSRLRGHSFVQKSREPISQNGTNINKSNKVRICRKRKNTKQG